MPIGYLLASTSFIHNTPIPGDLVSSNESQSWGVNIPHSFGKPRNFQRIAVPGDGSCLFHSTATGILDLIYEGKLKNLTTHISRGGERDFFNSLHQEIFKPETQHAIIERLKGDASDQPSLRPKVARMQQIFQDFKDNPDGLIEHLEQSVAKLKNSNNNSEEVQAEIAMWMHMLTAGFRKVRTNQLERELPGDRHLKESPYYGNNHDAVWLAKKFGAAVTAYKDKGTDNPLELYNARSQAISFQENEYNAILVGSKPLPKDAPGFSIIHHGAHYEYLCDLDRQDKLMDRLPNPEMQANLRVKLASKRSEKANLVTVKTSNMTDNQLQALRRKSEGLKNQLNRITSHINQFRSESPIQATINESGITLNFNKNDIEEYALMEKLMQDLGVEEFSKSPPDSTLSRSGQIFLPRSSVANISLAGFDGVKDGTDAIKKGIDKFLMENSSRFERQNNLSKLHDNLNTFNVLPQEYRIWPSTYVQGFNAKYRETGDIKEILLEFKDPVALKAMQEILNNKNIRYYYEPTNNYLIIRDQLFENNFTPNLKQDFISAVKKGAITESKKKLANLANAIQNNFVNLKQSIINSWSQACMGLTSPILTGKMQNGQFIEGKITPKEWEDIFRRHTNNMSKEDYASFVKDFLSLMTINKELKNLMGKLPPNFIGSLDPAKKPGAAASIAAGTATSAPPRSSTLSPNVGNSSLTILAAVPPAASPPPVARIPVITQNSAIERSRARALQRNTQGSTIPGARLKMPSLPEDAVPPILAVSAATSEQVPTPAASSTLANTMLRFHTTLARSLPPAANPNSALNPAPITPQQDLTHQASAGATATAAAVAALGSVATNNSLAVAAAVTSKEDYLKTIEKIASNIEFRRSMNDPLLAGAIVTPTGTAEDPALQIKIPNTIVLPQQAVGSLPASQKYDEINVRQQNQQILVTATADPTVKTLDNKTILEFVENGRHLSSKVMNPCNSPTLALKVFEAALMQGVDIKLDPSDLAKLEELGKTVDNNPDLVMRELGKHYNAIKDLTASEYREKIASKGLTNEEVIENLGKPKGLDEPSQRAAPF